MNGGTPIAGWFVMEHSIKMDNLGVPLFQEATIRSICDFHIVIENDTPLHD